jgi:hypothetical protein
MHHIYNKQQYTLQCIFGLAMEQANSTRYSAIFPASHETCNNIRCRSSQV